MLDGVVVLDLSRVLAGPWATQMLGDLGAEVIKVERPGAGDDTRSWGPPFVETTGGEHTDAAYYFCANRNKRSLCVDMATPEGVTLLRALAAKADVVVENFRTGGLRKYGLDYESLAEVNPRLVYCSLTGFGHTGPLAGRPGYDYMIQAMGGLMSITGQPDGHAGGEPMKVGVAVADLFTGVYAASAILAALYHVQKTGEGQHIDMALFDAQAAMLANQASNFFFAGKAPARMGNEHPNLAPYQPFATADGAVVIAVGNDAQFKALAGALGAPELALDGRFIGNAQRVEHREALVAAITSRTRGEPSARWIKTLEAAGVPCGPINRVDQVFEEAQAKARGLVVEQSREDLAEPVRSVASPLRLSRTPPSYRLAPPALGADTDAVLAERLGLSADQIESLRKAGVIA